MHLVFVFGLKMKVKVSVTLLMREGLFVGQRDDCWRKISLKFSSNIQGLGKVYICAGVWNWGGGRGEDVVEHLELPIRWAEESQCI